VLPLGRRTIALTRPAADRPSTISGNSRQKEGIIELLRSGRIMRTCATRSVISTSKHW
jgi:hypothetical protein